MRSIGVCIFMIFILKKGVLVTGSETEGLIGNLKEKSGKPMKPKRIILEESEHESKEDTSLEKLIDILPQDMGSKNGDGVGQRIGNNGLRCISCEPNCDEKSQYICLNAIQCLKTITRDSTGVERLSRGCIQDPGKVILLCKTRKHQKSSNQAHNTSREQYSHRGTYATVCCSDRDYCNDGPFPELPHMDLPHDATHSAEVSLTESEIWYIIAFVFVLFFMTIVTLGFLFAARRTHKKRLEAIKPKSEEFYQLDGEQLQVKAAGDSTLQEYMDGSMTSGSGSGLPLLIQRTLAKNIQLKRCIGKGRYGEVWQAIWNCENVAVKIFSSRDEASWNRETEIYSTVMLRHENILGFYGSDMISRNSVTQLWLVTHYHKYGSLYDFLNNKTLTQVQLLKFAYSIANGLAFLHSEMVGTESRAGIAHRDIKSKNILVNNVESCVIADFGLAVTHKRDTNELNVFPNPKVGTRRYMAPEILDESVNMKSFDAFKRADMYAVGLVLWEMCRRTTVQGESEPEDYQPPFFDIVPSDPSFEDMRKVVCEDESRPLLTKSLTDPVLSYFARLIRECWHQNPSVRLSALRVKKSVAVIAQEEFKGVLEAAIV